MFAIESENLTRIYHVGGEEVRALDGLTISLEQGELAAVVGPSGSGKSTLMALLGGLDTPTAGTVRVHGQLLNGMDPSGLAQYRRSMVGFVFQDFFLLSHLTAEENVEVPLKLSQVGRVERRRRAAELIKLVGLGHRGDHKPQQLSGGERQRVAIARALANRPKLLLADEPTGNLDEKTGRDITKILLGLNKEQDITVVLVTHNPELADQTERQFRLGGGKLQRTTTRSERIIPAIEESKSEPISNFPDTISEREENLEAIEAAPYEPVGKTDSVSVERASANVIISGIGLYTAEASEIVHEIRPNLSVFDVSGIFRNLPATIVEDISADKAKEIKGRLEAAGCIVELILGD